ncbi:MAG TPA: hypothetical protein VFN85_09230 [Solirubrobacterales bacterium]|nr:hypothetical protein [Solirubrobacterales bacterium]
MADDKSTGLDESPGFRTPHNEDDRDQHAVLWQVLLLHPISLTRAELERELTGAGLQNVLSRDAVERAVRELAGTGLLHPPCDAGRVVLPTRAALRYYELSEGAE